ncbi:MAG: hypothetical protein R3D45_13790 [Rhizobiaceae bacterium]
MSFIQSLGQAVQGTLTVKATKPPGFGYRQGGEPVFEVLGCFRKHAPEEAFKASPIEERERTDFQDTGERLALFQQAYLGLLYTEQMSAIPLGQSGLSPGDPKIKRKGM